MTASLRHTWYMSQRQMLMLFRQPVWIAITLIQPVIWILLYGQAWKQVTQLGAFGTNNYLTYLTPGIVVMTALFSGGWSGFGLIEDINHGVMDRFLVTPASRGSIIFGRMVQLAIIAAIQSAILLLIGFLTGADYSTVFGLMVLILAGILLGAIFGALSNAMSVVVRKEETVIAAVNFIILPLTFLSTVFLPEERLGAGWIRTFARFNPVDWAVEAGRRAVFPDPDWALISGRLGLLAVLAVACSLLATRAFRAYQRSV
ncbi:MAG TPA: ABC transporter permease [Actinomycetota bacterium]